MTRPLDIRIRSASERGYIVEEAGEVIAAFSSVDEVADWLRDRERPDVETVADVEALPSVFRARTEPKSFMQRVRGV